MPSFRQPTAHRQARPCLCHVLQSSQSRRRVIVRAITSNDIKNGTTLQINGEPWRVQEFLHVKPGKGAAFVRSKMKNLKSGTTMEKTFRAGEPLEVAAVNKQSCQFTYSEGDTYVFMDMSSYEEVRVPKEKSWAQFLKEGVDCDLVFYDGAVISVDPPQSMTLKVVKTQPGVKGDRSVGGTKPATLETGAEIQVPLFINEGDEIKLDGREGKYISRV